MVREKPWCYVAGPYRLPNRMANMRRAIAVGKQIRDELGVLDCVPHNDFVEQMQADEADEYYLAATMDKLRGCDCVYRFSMDYSAGSDAEVAEAERLGIPVFYTLPALAEWVRQWKAKHERNVQP